ncbi:two-component system response regulator [Betaproteobacteria bacterium]|nr:two-component system response regulator [Betaproteobacteria bacterium]
MQIDEFSHVVMMDENRKLIMLVDDDLVNLQVGKLALSAMYRVLTVPSAEKMFTMLERYSPELILLDINMPDMDGFEAIRILKEKAATRDIPVIFLTAINDDANELKGLSLGAVNYIPKPFSPPLLRKRIELHLQLKDFNDNLQQMVAAKTKTVIKLQNKILRAVAELVECRDDMTGKHIERTQHYIGIIVRELLDQGLYAGETSGWDVGLIQQSSMLHDVGKISIADRILKKPGPLTPEEFNEIKIHADAGVRIIERIEEGDEDNAFLSYAKIFAGYHHEKWDGTGYPHGLSGENIPLLGRIMAIADVYDVLTSVRPYKKAFSHEHAVSIIVEASGTRFDPALIRLFEQVADQFIFSRDKP